MSNGSSTILMVLGVIVLVVGIVLSVTSDLVGTLPHGLNGATENAVLFLFIGIACLLAGFGLRR